MPHLTPGQLLDSLGIALPLDDGDLVESAVVVARVIESDGGVNITIGSTDRMASLDQLGLITAAQQICVAGWRRRGEDD